LYAKCADCSGMHKKKMKRNLNTCCSRKISRNEQNPERKLSLMESSTFNFMLVIG
jgi:hypothetical protein